MREGHNIVRCQQWIPQLYRGRREHHVVPCILSPRPVQPEKILTSLQRHEREHKLCAGATFQNCQTACANTDNTVVHHFIRWRERDREVCGESSNLVLVMTLMSEYCTRLRKNHQCLRGHNQCLHSNINERERRGAVRTLAQGNTTVLQLRSSCIPGKLTTSSRTAVSCSLCQPGIVDHHPTRAMKTHWITFIEISLALQLKIGQLSVIQTLHVLSHDNAEVERGFYINKHILQDNLTGASLIAPHCSCRSINSLGRFSQGYRQNVFEAQQTTALKLAPYPKPAITIFIFFSCCN